VSGVAALTVRPPTLSKLNVMPASRPCAAVVVIVVPETDAIVSVVLTLAT
jgi:hypothetical protein